MNSFKITILGAQNSGKTCYMYAMYKIMSEGRDGFTFTACQPYSLELDKDAHNELLKGWQIISQKKEWVPGTIGSGKNYNFSFNYAGKSLISFEYLDYRGSALKDGKDSKDYQTLLSNLSNSQVIMWCVPGQYWKDQDEDEYSNIDLEISNINALLADLKSKRDKDKKPVPPVILLITKYDQCKNVPSDNLQRLIKSKLNILFTKEGDWLVTIMKSTLGFDLSEFDNDLEKATIKPKWIMEPIAFAIYFVFEQLKKAFSEDISYHSREADRYKGSFLGIKDWWFSEEIEHHELREKKASDEIDFIKKYAPLVKETFFPKDSAYFYFKGKKLKLEQLESLISGNKTDM
ncbi:MAG: hypothetical protein R3D00_24650 [Bacteroidia bacterium]